MLIYLKLWSFQSYDNLPKSLQHHIYVKMTRNTAVLPDNDIVQTSGASRVWFSVPDYGYPMAYLFAMCSFYMIGASTVTRDASLLLELGQSEHTVLLSIGLLTHYVNTGWWPVLLLSVSSSPTHTLHITLADLHKASICVTAFTPLCVRPYIICNTINDDILWRCEG